MVGCGSFYSMVVIFVNPPIFLTPSAPEEADLCRLIILCPWILNGFTRYGSLGESENKRRMSLESISLAHDQPEHDTVILSLFYLNLFIYF